MMPILTSAVDLIVQITSDGIIQLVNPACCKVFRYKEVELIEWLRHSLYGFTWLIVDWICLYMLIAFVRMQISAIFPFVDAWCCLNFGWKADFCNSLLYFYLVLRCWLSLPADFCNFTHSVIFMYCWCLMLIVAACTQLYHGHSSNGTYLCCCQDADFCKFFIFMLSPADWRCLLLPAHNLIPFTILPVLCGWVPLHDVPIIFWNWLHALPQPLMHSWVVASLWMNLILGRSCL